MSDASFSHFIFAKGDTPQRGLSVIAQFQPIRKPRQNCDYSFGRN